MTRKSSEATEERRSSSTVNQTKEKEPQNDSIRAVEDESHKSASPVPMEIKESETDQITSNEPQMQYYHGFKLVVIVLGLCFGMALVALDGTLLATAIPRITTEFHSLNDIGWYISTYFIAISALQPAVGRIFQMFSPKWCYVVFTTILAVGSVVCARANSSPVLIVGRAITGIGGSGLLPGSIIIISFIAEPKLQPALNGLVAGTYGLASIIAPVIGGAFTQYVTWRWCFYLNLPLAAFTATVIFFFFDPQTTLDSYHLSLPDKLKKLDWIGFAIFCGGNAMLLLGLQWGGNTYDWSSSKIIGLLVGAAVTLALFAVWQWYKQEDAGVPPRIMSHPVVVILATVSFLAIGGFQIFTYYLPIFFQSVMGVSPSGSGVRYLPTVIADFLSATIGGGLIAKIGYYNPFFLLAFILYIAGLAMATTFKVDTTTGFWIGAQILAGAGNGFFVPLAWTVVQNNIALKDNSIAIASVVYFQLLGAAVFQAIAHQIFQSLLTMKLQDAAYNSGEIQGIFDVGAANVSSLTGDEKNIVVQGYLQATTSTFYASIAAFAVAFLISLGLKWKKIGQQKAQSSQDDEPDD